MDLWLTYIVLNTILCLTPGAAVSLIMNQSAGSGWKRTQAGIAGVLLANFLYSLLAIMGLGLALSRSPILYSIIRLAGAGFMAYLGIRSILSKPSTSPEIQKVEASSVRLFKDGFLLQISNPKAIMAFGALLPQFVIPGYSPLLQMLGLTAISLIIEWPVLTLYAVLGETIRRKFGSVFLVRLSGIMLIVIAAAMVLSWWSENQCLFCNWLSSQPSANEALAYQSISNPKLIKH